MGVFSGINSLFGDSVDWRDAGVGRVAKTPSRGGGRRGFDWGQAALALFGGPQVASAMQRRRLAEAEAEREQQVAGSLMGNAAELRDRQGNPMFTKAQIGAMRPEDLSQAVRDRLQLRQFAAGGGSVMDPNGNTVMAPSRHEYQGTVFDIGSDGNPVLRRRGVQAVPTQPGGEVAFVDTWEGREASDLPGMPQPNPPPAAVQSQGAMTEEQAREQARQAILNGADPRAVNDRLNRFLQQRQQGGAVPSNGPGRFR